jgi:hypothetical protein
MKMQKLSNAIRDDIAKKAIKDLYYASLGLPELIQYLPTV